MLFLRALLSPAGHASWTGLVAAVMWRSRPGAPRPVGKGAVLGAFVLAVVLHALWDGDPSAVGHLAVGAVSLLLLADQVHKTAPPAVQTRGPVDG